MVKEALYLPNTEETFLNEVLLAAAGVCFSSTPHRGFKVASIRKTVLVFQRCCFKTLISRSYVHSRLNQKCLSELEGTSPTSCGRGRSVCVFREEVGTKRVMIVNDSLQQLAIQRRPEVRSTQAIGILRNSPYLWTLAS